MKPLSVACVLVLLLCASSFTQDTLPRGEVYGPKAAFRIDAPQGWVLDNHAGLEQGLHCVLYPKGSSWTDARTIMYAKIASPEFEDVNAFVAFAIKQMQKVHATPKEKIASGKTRDGKEYFINEYPATESNSQWERVAYVQLPRAVAYIVLSSQDEASYRKDAGALQEVLQSFAYREPPAESEKH